MCFADAPAIGAGSAGCGWPLIAAFSYTHETGRTALTEQESFSGTCSVGLGASATRVRGSGSNGSNGSCLPFDGNPLSRSNEAWNYLELVSVQIHDHLFV